MRLLYFEYLLCTLWLLTQGGFLGWLLDIDMGQLLCLAWVRILIEENWFMTSWFKKEGFLLLNNLVEVSPELEFT